MQEPLGPWQPPALTSLPCFALAPTEATAFLFTSVQGCHLAALTEPLKRVPGASQEPLKPWPPSAFAPSLATPWHPLEPQPLIL